MTAISMNGRERLFSTRAMIMKIAAMETILTILKSLSVVSIISFVHGASPMSIPFGSYFFRIEFRLSICRLTSSPATLYSELTRSSSHLSLFRTSLTDSGRNSCGTDEPTMLSSPSTYFTPSTPFISFIIDLTSFAGRVESVRIICVEAISNSSESLLCAMTYSISSGRHLPRS